MSPKQQPYLTLYQNQQQNTSSAWCVALVDKGELAELLALPWAGVVQLGQRGIMELGPVVQVSAMSGTGAMNWPFLLPGFPCFRVCVHVFLRWPLGASVGLPLGISDCRTAAFMQRSLLLMAQEGVKACMSRFTASPASAWRLAAIRAEQMCLCVQESLVSPLLLTTLCFLCPLLAAGVCSAVATGFSDVARMMLPAPLPAVQLCSQQKLFDSSLVA
eukprot:GHUV01020213.1.p1 GENE.GHUV01020213.1~~GHUV01020213.1.p1  ORF type:complete len:217 (-),score=26.46 GHUV01020213.1:460-1110(-)